MADAKGRGKLAAALEDAQLETELPARFTGQPGSLDTPIARTARLNMLKDAASIANSEKNADKYIGYANQEAREAAAEERRETGRMHPEAKKKGGTIKSSASRRADGCAVKGKTKGRIV